MKNFGKFVPKSMWYDQLFFINDNFKVQLVHLNDFDI